MRLDDAPETRVPAEKLRRGLTALIEAVGELALVLERGRQREVHINLERACLIAQS